MFNLKATKPIRASCKFCRNFKDHALKFFCGNFSKITIPQDFSPGIFGDEFGYETPGMREIRSFPHAISLPKFKFTFLAFSGPYSQAETNIISTKTRTKILRG